MKTSDRIITSHADHCQWKGGAI